MGIDRNDSKARQLLEKLLRKGSGVVASGATRLVPPARARNEGEGSAVPAARAEAQSQLRPRGQDRGKRPIGEGESPTTAKRARVEVEEGVVPPPPIIHPVRLKDFLDTNKLVLSGEMSWEGLAGTEST